MAAAQDAMQSEARESGMAPEATERSSTRDDRAQSRGASNRTVAHVVAASLKRHGVEFIIGQSAPTRLFLLAPD
jgi:hypothetical protein